MSNIFDELVELMYSGRESEMCIDVNDLEEWREKWEPIIKAVMNDADLYRLFTEEEEGEALLAEAEAEAEGIEQEYAEYLFEQDKEEEARRAAYDPEDGDAWEDFV